MKKKGAALLTVVIITSVIFVIAVTLLDRSIRTYRDTMDMISGKEAYYTAESLIYDAVGFANDNQSVVAVDAVIDLRTRAGFRKISLKDTTIKNLTITKKAAVTTTNPINRFTYNVECELVYKNTAYVVKMQIETTTINGRYTGHSVLDRKTYKYKP